MTGLTGGPVHRAVIVEADGGSRGNPGPAGYGAVVLDPATGEVLAERKQAIGVETNNVAEYQGLIAGLTAAAELGAQTVRVRMDSKLVIEQMSGRWQIKHESMKPLARRAAELADRFRDVDYEWIPRERNTRADRLANEAMDAGPPAEGSLLAQHFHAEKRLTEPGAESTPSENKVIPAAVFSDLPKPIRTGQAGVASSAANQAKLVQPTPQSAWVPPDTTPTRLILLRHGVTDDTIKKVFAGRSDPELNSEGRIQVARAAERVRQLGPVDRIFASPLRRTQATARAAAELLRAPVELDSGFVETNFGDWDGHTYAQVMDKWPDELKQWMNDERIAPPGGESFDDVTRRVSASRDRIVESFPGKTLLICSHVTPIKVLVRLALQAPPSAMHRMFLAPASISVVDYYADGPVSLRSFNDSAHL